MSRDEERSLIVRLVWRVKIGLLALAVAAHWHLETRSHQPEQRCTTVIAGCMQLAHQQNKLKKAASACDRACRVRARPKHAPSVAAPSQDDAPAPSLTGVRHTPS